MPRTDSAAEGRALIAARVAEAPGLIAGIPDRVAAMAALDPRGPRALVATGIGTSEGHARHFSEVAARCFGWPARFASTGSLAEAAPPGADRDWLVVFSQGLSANARHALSHVDAWAGVLLVTGLSPDLGEADGLSAEKKEWLAALEARGVIRVDLGCGAEYGTLLRVIGARAGYVAGWSVLRTIASARLEEVSPLEISGEALEAAQRESAREEARRAFPDRESVAAFFDASRTLLLVGEGGVLEWVDQLTLKLAEGLLRPQPRAVDVLQFAHGPLQALAERRASILYLAGPRSGSASAWLERFASTLDPELHDLRVLHTSLDWPFAAIEYEALFDHLVLEGLEASGGNLVEWPGADREEALYAAGPSPLSDREVRSNSGSSSLPSYEASVWPEIEERVREGQRCALIGLGSIEQHGPHLPLGTDRWIAEALLEGLAARLDDAIAVPAIALGCASEHLDFAGTLHIEPATLEAVLVDVFGSLARHGFERAFLFTAHGGNLDALDDLHSRLVDAARPLNLHIETDQRIGAMQSAIVEAASLAPNAAGPHAGEYETSLVAYLRPGTIRTDQLVPGRIVEPGESQGLFYPSLRPNTESGVLGDPSAAAAARGRRYLDAWLDLLESGYREAFRKD